VFVVSGTIVARILYGVQGDAGGHVSRSLTIARQLHGHEVVFVGGGRVAQARRHGYDVVDVPMLANVYTNNRLDLPATLMAGARALRDRARIFDRLTSLIRDFDPDLILTDYEPFLPQAARLAGRPSISINRQHFLTHCDYTVPSGAQLARLLAMQALRRFHMSASQYFIVSFTKATAKEPKTAEVFPSVIRPEVAVRSGSDSGAVLAYLPLASPDWMRRTFAGLDRKVIVYGQNRDGDVGNLSFRPRTSDGFADDLAQSAFVVSHAGSNLIAESLFLKKPVLTFPTARIFEQYLNAHLLAGAGYGKIGSQRNSAASVAAFDRELHLYRSRLEQYRPWRDTTVVDRLSGLLAR